MSSVKIQINSLPALMHLLENQDEVAMEIRNSVVKAYEKKAVLPSIVARLKQMVQAQVDALLCKTAKFGRFELKPNVKAQIEAVAKKAGRDEVYAIAKKCLLEATTPDRIKEQVELLVTQTIRDRVRREVAAKLDEAGKILGGQQ